MTDQERADELVHTDQAYWDMLPVLASAPQEDAAKLLEGLLLRFPAHSVPSGAGYGRSVEALRRAVADLLGQVSTHGESRRAAALQFLRAISEPRRAGLGWNADELIGLEGVKRLARSGHVDELGEMLERATEEHGAKILRALREAVNRQFNRAAGLDSDRIVHALGRLRPKVSSLCAADSPEIQEASLLLLLALDQTPSQRKATATRFLSLPARADRVRRIARAMLSQE